MTSVYRTPKTVRQEGQNSNHPREINIIIIIINNNIVAQRPPLWSSGQSFWLQIQRSRVRSPALPDFLSINGSGTGSTQPREPRGVN